MDVAIPLHKKNVSAADNELTRRSTGNLERQPLRNRWPSIAVETRIVARVATMRELAATVVAIADLSTQR